MGIVVGIDLGTTNSAISYIDEYNKVTIIPNKEGKNITPSVICFTENAIIVGEEAKELQKLGIYEVAAFFKRSMGDENFYLNINNHNYSATELSSLIIKKLIQDAKDYLGKEITDAVITVPAYFKNKEREATIKAGELAGLNILQVVNEPTAAAIAYGVKNLNSNQKILVYDLGGGTFDVTLMDISNNSIKILTSEGDHQLGGKDWDDRLISYIATKFEEEFGIDPLEDAESVADLLVRVEEAKKKLSQLQKTTISLSYDGMRGKYEITRDVFEEITADLMERTIFLTQEVLNRYGLQPNDIDGILLVGGSTKMPMVHKFIKERFNQEPLRGVNVDEAVSIGATLIANEQKKLVGSLRGSTNKKDSSISIDGKIKLQDVTNHSLGMIAINEDNTKYVNSFIIPKDTTIPATFTKEFKHKGKILEVYLTQGESREVDDVDYLGKYVVKDIPFNKEGNSIFITYEYDYSGVVNVKALVNNKSLPVFKESLSDNIIEKFIQPPKNEPTVQFITAYLAFDISGSMSGSPLEDAKKAAKEFVDNMNLDYSAIGLIVFSDRVKTILKASQNKQQIYNAINQIDCCETGCCNKANPFDDIYSYLSKKEDRKIAIVLADGMWENQDNAITEAKKCHKAGIEIKAIGFGSADKEFLKKIASNSDDGIFTTQNKLVETFATIAQEIGG